MLDKDAVTTGGGGGGYNANAGREVQQLVYLSGEGEGGLQMGGR